MYVLLQNVQIYVHMYSMHYVKSNTSLTLFVGVRRCFHLNHVFTVCDYLLLKHIKNDAKNTHVFHSIRLDHVRSNRHCKHLCKFYRYVRKKNKLIFHRNRSKYANLVFKCSCVWIAICLTRDSLIQSKNYSQYFARRTKSWEIKKGERNQRWHFLEFLE